MFSIKRRLNNYTCSVHCQIPLYTTNLTCSVLQMIHESQAPFSVKTQLIQSGLGAEEDIWA